MRNCIAWSISQLQDFSPNMTNSPRFWFNKNFYVLTLNKCDLLTRLIDQRFSKKELILYMKYENQDTSFILDVYHTRQFKKKKRVDAGDVSIFTSSKLILWQVNIEWTNAFKLQNLHLNLFLYKGFNLL